MDALSDHAPALAPAALQALPQGHLSTTVARVAYHGLLGQPDWRVLGSHTLYACVDAPLLLSLQADTVAAHTVWVPPQLPHRIAAASELATVLCVMVEPESVAPASLGWPAGAPPGEAAEWLSRVARLCAALDAQPDGQALDDATLDTLLFGAPLAARALDARIASVVARMAQSPADAVDAAGAAASCGLSVSRFLHLFKAELGVSWRAFRAWKRARSLLPCVRSGDNLTHIAQTLGYPDASHFSHTIRQVTGFRPSEIVAGARLVRVMSDEGKAGR